MTEARTDHAVAVAVRRLRDKRAIGILTISILVVIERTQRVCHDVLADGASCARPTFVASRK